MSNFTDTRARLLARLESSPATMAELRKVCDLSAAGVRTLIWRLREAGYEIELRGTGRRSLPPEYRLVAFPGSLRKIEDQLA